MAAPAERGFTQAALSDAGASTSPAGTQINDVVVIAVWSQGTTIPTHTLKTDKAYETVATRSYNDGTTDGILSVARVVADTAGAVAYTPYTIAGATTGQTAAGCFVVQRGTFNMGTWPSATANLTTTGTPNPPAITGLTGDFLAFAVSGWHVTTAAATVTTAPTNYVEKLDGPTGTHVTHLALATRALTGLSGATEDPGTFTDNVTPNGSGSITFAIPGRSGITGTGATSATAETSAASGAASTSGSSATAAGAQVSAATGTVAGDITGTAATASSAQVSAASATVEDGAPAIDGSGGTASSAQASAASGAVEISGTAATASSAQASSASEGYADPVQYTETITALSAALGCDPTPAAIALALEASAYATDLPPEIRRERLVVARGFARYVNAIDIVVRTTPNIIDDL